MELVYNYSGRNSYDDVQRGMVIATSEEEARDKIIEMGIAPLICDPDYNNSVAILGSLSLEEYYKFYNFIGRIIKNGASPATSIEDYIDLVDNIRMKCMISTVLACLKSGFGMSVAMEKAGFPEPHYMTVRALEESGDTSRAFGRLGAECREQFLLKNDIASMLRQPKVFFAIFLIAIYGFFGFFMFKSINGLIGIIGKDEVPEYSMILGNASRFCNENIVMFSLVYWGVVVAIVYFLRSKQFKIVFNKIPLVRKLTERIDMYNGWSSFGTLNSSGVSNSLSCDLISRSMSREDTSSMFLIMRTALSSGDNIPTAVKKAGFPDYIFKKIRAIDLQGGGDTGELIISMSEELKEQVSFIVDALKSRCEFLIKIATAVSVLIFFMLTYYPMLKATLSAV